MFVQGFFDEATFTITYLVADEDSGEAVIIDPVTEYDAGRAKLASTPIDLVLDVATDKEPKRVQRMAHCINWVA